MGDAGFIHSRLGIWANLGRHEEISTTALGLYLNQASFEDLLKLTASVQGHHSRRLVNVCADVSWWALIFVSEIPPTKLNEETLGNLGELPPPISARNVGVPFSPSSINRPPTMR